MATTALWVLTAAIVVAILVWRLRRASHTLETILRDERERDPEPARADTDDEHREVGHRRQDG